MRETGPGVVLNHAIATATARDTAAHDPGGDGAILFTAARSSGRFRRCMHLAEKYAFL